MTRSVLILGATSSLAQHIALEIITADDHVALAARDKTELRIIASNVRARCSATVSELFFDALDFSGHSAFHQSVKNAIGVPDLVIIASGALGDQLAARTNENAIADIGASNFLGIATGLAGVIADMEKLGRGHIILLSSVAGDRGRASNYIYGAAKAGASAYFAGLRARLHPANVRVTTAKLGFVDTQMVFGMQGAFLVAKPEWIAKRIHDIIKKPRDVVYLPRFWRLIMLLIRLTPETIFKRLPL